MKKLFIIAATASVLMAGNANAGSWFWGYNAGYDNHHGYNDHYGHGYEKHHRRNHHDRWDNHNHDCRKHHGHVSIRSIPAFYSVRQINPVVYQPVDYGYAEEPIMLSRNGSWQRNGMYCREYQSRVNVGSRIQESYGTACLQPDGSWKIID